LVDDGFKAMNRTHEQIRQHGASGNFAEGIEIPIHDVRTRLIAWPGNGFQTESVHVLTLAPGDASPLYRYQMSEEALLCLKGQGEGRAGGVLLAAPPERCASVAQRGDSRVLIDPPGPSSTPLSGGRPALETSKLRPARKRPVVPSTS
jgi:hypothetical protein